MKLADFELERYFARHEFSARHLLCASDVESFRLHELLAMADEEGRALWDRLALGYTESAGHPLLREEIAALYDEVAPEQVLVFSGAEEAIFVLVVALLGPGDHALVTWPAYQSLHEVARASGAAVAPLPLAEERGWRLEPSDVRSALRPDTRLLVVNFPHNPTGALPARDAFAELVGIAEEAGITLLSDEVYRLLEYDPADRLPAAADLSRRAVSLGVMSKAFGLAGLRIGWLATRDEELLRRCAALKDYTTICCSAPSEVLAIVALRARERILDRNRAIVAGNLARLDAFLARHADTFSWSRPRAGATGFPRLLAATPVERWTQELIERHGVLLLPGTVYDDAGNHFRIGFGRRSFAEGLARLEAALTS